MVQDNSNINKSYNSGGEHIENGDGARHEFQINRDIFQHDRLAAATKYKREKKNALEHVTHKIKTFSIIGAICSVIPVLEWLPNYAVKENLVGDITAGATVAVMHIPQGMAYALLANVEPIVGLYMAFFHSLVYFVLGTSRHLSVASFPIVSLMVANIITKINLDVPEAEQYAPLQIATAVSMTVGLIQLLLFLFRMGALSSLLSDPLVKGFTTGAAIHIIVSQLKDLFGITITAYNGPFNVILTVIDVLKGLGRTNWVALVVSVVVIVFMYLANDYAKPYLFEKYKFPLPTELMVVIGGTLASKYMELGPKNGLSLIGTIPTGLPVPEFPPPELFLRVAVDSIAITIVSYTINVSMAFIFAKRQNYEINANQEFFALGVSNVVGANFACLPNACALSRSIIQEQTGGKTQVAGVVTSALILIVLLWIGPFFEPLPKCVLAGIIIMAIKGMLAQLFELKKVVKEGIFETVIWLGTFLAVVILDMDLGLLVGVVISLFALYIKGWKSYYCLVGTLPDTGMYVDVSTHRAAVEVANVKIFRYSGAVNFSTRTGFKKALYETISSEIKARESVLEEDQRRDLELITSKVTPTAGLHTVIVDLSFILHLDVAGVKCLDDIRKDVSGRLGINFLLAAPCDRVYDALLKATAYDVDTFEVFSTVHDAVLNGLKK